MNLLIANYLVLEEVILNLTLNSQTPFPGLQLFTIYGSL